MYILCCELCPLINQSISDMELSYAILDCVFIFEFAIAICQSLAAVIYLQFYTHASQDLLGLYKVSPTRKSLRPLQNFPL